jgi:hypothetical protein
VLLCAAAVLLTAYAVINTTLYGGVLPPYDSSRNAVNIVFKFGTGARNELDTFQGTFTKDLCIDGTVTTRMVLSEAELEQVRQKIVEAEFFSCPETFPLKETLTAPDYSYYMMVQDGNNTKEVTWSNNSEIDSSTQNKLDNLTDFLINLISEKPECQRLPQPNGAYL